MLSSLNVIRFLFNHFQYCLVLTRAGSGDLIPNQTTQHSNIRIVFLHPVDCASNRWISVEWN